MELEQCKLCGTDLEDMEYGRAVPNDKSPCTLSICYNCLKELKQELAKIKIKGR